MQSPENNTTPAAPNNDMGELRSHLFDTLRALKAKTIDAEQARAVNDTAQTIINSAKVEVDYLKATGQTDGIKAEIGRSVEIDRHYLIPCAKAHEVERDVRRRLAHRGLGMDATWFGVSIGEAIDAVARSLQALGADQPVMRGTLHPKRIAAARCAL